VRTTYERKTIARDDSEDLGALAEFGRTNGEALSHSRSRIHERFVQVQLASLMQMSGQQARHPDQSALAPPLLKTAVAGLVRRILNWQLRPVRAHGQSEEIGYTTIPKLFPGGDMTNQIAKGWSRFTSLPGDLKYFIFQPKLNSLSYLRAPKTGSIYGCPRTEAGNILPYAVAVNCEAGTTRTHRATFFHHSRRSSNTPQGVRPLSDITGGTTTMSTRTEESAYVCNESSHVLYQAHHAASDASFDIYCFPAIRIG
jgi:hypothetical protein